MEIKILVKENQKKDLERFIETCKQQGFVVTHEGGGKIPNWSGWFAELKGERWQKQSELQSNCNLPHVSNSFCSCDKTQQKASMVGVSNECSKCGKGIEQNDR